MALGLILALGVLQGLTEFLPVSSSGHLRLCSAWFGVQDPQTLFDVILHVGTLIPVMIVYRAPVLKLLKLQDLRLAGILVVATIPTGLIGLLLGDAMEGLAADVRFVGAALAVNGLILLALGRLEGRQVAEEAKGRGLDEITIVDALVVGTVQGLAVFRGISRSGSTITAGLVRGLDREAAAALSFLLSIPAISGALVLEVDASAMAAEGLGTYLIGGAAAAISGTAALIGLLGLLKRGRLHHFAWYCFAVAIVVFVTL